MRTLVLLAIAMNALSTAAARSQRPDDIACRDSATTGVSMYRRCALRIEGSAVRRGETGAVVTRKVILMPPHLSRVVAGDSALAYANLFERRSKESTALYLAAGILAGLSVKNAKCGGIYSGCAYDWSFGSPALTLLASGTVLGGIGKVFQIRAARAGTRAVWWNNSRFGR